VKGVQEQIDTLLKYSKHFGTDIGKLTPAILAETGQGAYTPATQASISGQAVASSPGAIISAASSGISSILSGLFA
jgi:hypothetical protein